MHSQALLAYLGGVRYIFEDHRVFYLFDVVRLFHFHGVVR